MSDWTAALDALAAYTDRLLAAAHGGEPVDAPPPDLPAGRLPDDLRSRALALLMTVRQSEIRAAARLVRLTGASSAYTSDY